MNKYFANNKQKLKEIVIIIFMIIIFVLLLRILNLKNRIDSLIIDNESLCNYVSNIESQTNSQIDSLNFQIINEASKVKTKVAELQNEVSYINNDYVNKNSINDITHKIQKLYETYINNDYSFEEDMDGVNIKLNNLKEKIDDLNDKKEDKINKVNDVDESYSDEEYPSIATIKTEEMKLFDAIYPVGSVYISLNGVLPKYGTWTKLDSNRVLWNSDDGGGDYLEPTLPNVSGNAAAIIHKTMSGPFYASGTSSQKTFGSNCYVYQMYFNMHDANPIYQDGATVRPPAIAVTMFKRTA